MMKHGDNCAKPAGMARPKREAFSFPPGAADRRRTPPRSSANCRRRLFRNPGSAQDCRLHDEVNTSWGRYIHVNFDDKETDRIWPMPAADRQDELIIQSERSEPEAGTGTSGVDELAEWVFARYEKERRFKPLYAEAKEPGSGIGSFLKQDLLAAYQRVYQTKAHHPPAAGWPMQPEFRRRWHSRKATE